MVGRSRRRGRRWVCAWITVEGNEIPRFGKKMVRVIWEGEKCLTLLFTRCFGEMEDEYGVISSVRKSLHCLKDKISQNYVPLPYANGPLSCQ